MLTKKEIKKVLSNVNNNFIDDNTFINQTLRLLNTIFEEVENFDAKKEYGEVYINFRKGIDEKYMNLFTDILDFSIRLIIHEIYLNNESTTNINIKVDNINIPTSANRKHFEVAKEIAEKTIKTYYFSNCSNKKIINYIDDYLPTNYVKNRDINKVVWYFIVNVVSFNKQILFTNV